MNQTAMNTNAKLPTKTFYWLLFACALIVVMASLDVMFRVKDKALFDKWVEISKLTGDTQTLLGTYVTGNLSVFFMKIIVPAFFALYTYYAYVKVRINYLYIFMWTVLILGSMAYTLVQMQLFSVFFYLQLGGYFILIVNLLSLVDVVKQNKSK